MGIDSHLFARYQERISAKTFGSRAVLSNLRVAEFCAKIQVRVGTDTRERLGLALGSWRLESNRWQASLQLLTSKL
jgi:hypothetical protein